TAGQIDNAKSPHAETNARCDEEAIVIRTSMTDGSSHLPQERRVISRFVGSNVAGDAAHWIR
ncbi:MAG: hypothetical protein ACXV8H_10625, partial [Chthoniobacterales bacterium]